jgi:hypothetical protein
VRDLRVRWALERVGLAYEERLIGPEDQKSECYRAPSAFPAGEEIDRDQPINTACVEVSEERGGAFSAIRGAPI